MASIPTVTDRNPYGIDGSKIAKRKKTYQEIPLVRFKNKEEKTPSKDGKKYII